MKSRFLIVTIGFDASGLVAIAREHVLLYRNATENGNIMWSESHFMDHKVH